MFVLLLAGNDSLASCFPSEKSAREGRFMFFLKNIAYESGTNYIPGNLIGFNNSKFSYQIVYHKSILIFILQ